MMTSIQVRQCEKCGKIFENLTVNVCDVCNCDIPISFKTIEVKNEKEQDLWYKQCPICSTWHVLKTKNEITKCCKHCGQTDINNLGEDRVFSYFQYQQIMEREDAEVVGEKESEPPQTKQEIENKEEKIKYIELKNQLDGKVIRISPGRYVLGASGDVESDYFYPLKYVGGKHMFVYVEDMHVYIVDNNSKNKTRINGKVILKEDGEKEIFSEDKVTMADQIFEVIVCR
jgi:predicted  nucleic acid-binding Zn-ribbon protein